MKKLIALTAATAALALPAMAGTMTISFANDNGETVVMTFDDSTNTATVEGQEGSFAYTWDAEANKLCGDATGEGEVCATFAEKAEPSVGTTSGLFHVRWWQRHGDDHSDVRVIAAKIDFKIQSNAICRTACCVVSV